MTNNVKRSGGYRMTIGCMLLAVCLIILLPIAVSAMDNGTASTALFIAAGIAAIAGIFLTMNGSLARRHFDNRVVSYDNASEHDGEPTPPPLYARRPRWADRPANHMGDNQLGPRQNSRDRN